MPRNSSKKDRKGGCDSCKKKGNKHEDKPKDDCCEDVCCQDYIEVCSVRFVLTSVKCPKRKGNCSDGCGEHWIASPDKCNRCNSSSSTEEDSCDDKSESESKCDDNFSSKAWLTECDGDNNQGDSNEFYLS